MHRSRSVDSNRRHFRCLLGATALMGVVLTGGVSAAAPPAKQTSSCVACHTDAEKLKLEAATVPVPAGSALQAGKG